MKISKQKAGEVFWWSFALSVLSFECWIVIVTRQEKKMTKKDFETVAKSVSLVPVRGDRWKLASMLADNFEAMYPRFDRGRFISACRPKND